MHTTDWLKNPSTALFALGSIGIWQAIGLNMVLFLAGLKAIPRDLYEAAAVDGADGTCERFRSVTWPMLGPVTLFVVTITAVRSFQVFDTVAVLTDGGPNKATKRAALSNVPGGLLFPARGVRGGDHRGLSRLRAIAHAPASDAAGALDALWVRVPCAAAAFLERCSRH